MDAEAERALARPEGAPLVEALSGSAAPQMEPASETLRLRALETVFAAGKRVSTAWAPWELREAQERTRVAPKVWLEPEAPAPLPVPVQPTSAAALLA
jgi:hypothetical protein